MIALASGSPRRAELLRWVGLEVEVFPQDIDETRRADVDPVVHARTLARAKARKARDTVGERTVIAADTVVHRDLTLYEKPVDRADAVRMLTELSGGDHLVTTGVCVVSPEGRVEVFSVTSLVRFRQLSAAEIADYVATGDAADKAGAYGIQGRAGAFVAYLEGSWTNVMGLPVAETLRALAIVEKA